MKLLKLLLESKIKFALYLFGALLTIVTGIFSTLALSNAFSIIEESEPKQIQAKIIIAATFALTPVILQTISRLLRIGFMREILYKVRIQAFLKIINLDIASYKEKTQENYFANLVSDINLFESDFFLSLLNIVFAFGSFLVGILILLYLAPLVALITFITALLLFIITKIFEKPLQKQQAKILEANVDYNQNLTNNLNGLEIISLYNVQAYFKQNFSAMIAVLEQIKQGSFKLKEFQHNLNNWLASSIQILTYIYATYLYVNHKLSLTELIIIFNLVGQLIWSMISGFSFINRIKVANQVYLKITEAPQVFDATLQFHYHDKLKIKDLTFNYQNQNIISNLSLEIDPLDKVLIIGTSGSGKTTLLNILTKTLNNYLGEIYFDKRSLKEIDPISLYQKIGYIRQSHFLFEASIKDNIILNQTFEEEKFNNILKQLKIFDWINTLENQANHLLVNNGTNISGGQRQLISIARELYADKEILLVDEPAASLDDYSAKQVYQALVKLDKTIFCVSHHHQNYLKKYFNKVISFEETGQVYETI